MKISTKSVLLSLALAFIFFPQSVGAIKIGIISDIHAGHDRVRNYHKFTPRNILYPRRFKPYLTKAIKDFKFQGVEAIVLNGDATGGDRLKYAQAVKKIVNSSGIENFWVLGNHEGKKIKRVYFASGSYSFVDRGGWRLIFLDSNTVGRPNSMGGVDEVQINWLRGVIADASGPVAVFMHHPIFMLRSGQPDAVYSGYTELEKVFSESGKVKYVISGHYHPYYQFNNVLNDVQYIVNIPLTLKSHLGSYQILDLPEPEPEAE